MSLDLNEPKFDRSFDDIYSDLRSRIPRFNREWTNYNDSDPGITLLQLFAWLAEMTLHRMNELPRKNYIKFAQLLDLQLKPALPARVYVAFTAKPAEPPSTIPAGTRVSATVEGRPPVIFETERPLDVIGAPLAAAIVLAGASLEPVELAGDAAKAFYPFGRNPAIGNALYFAFKPNPNNAKPFPRRMTFLALRPEADTKGGPLRAGDVDVDLVPPVDLVWEARPGAQDIWERLSVVDESVAFTRDGFIFVDGPANIVPSIDPLLKAVVPEPHYWLRVRLDGNSYPQGRPPRLEHLLPNAVQAVNLLTEENTTLGQSSGRAAEQFSFPLRRTDPSALEAVEPASLEMVVRLGDEETTWTRKDDLNGSKREDRHFVLDATAGRITFGDGEHGEIPLGGADVIAVKWRHGGGAAGNLAGPGAVKTIVTPVAGIERVHNPRPATGGAAEQSIEDFIKEVPRRLRSRGRAVTADDFEVLALEVNGVRKARAIAGKHPAHDGVDVPGALTVVIVPDSDERPPRARTELIRSVARHLDGKRLITSEVHVASPAFLEIRIEARLLAPPEAAFDDVAQRARKRLDEFLDPRTWHFGANVSPAAVYRALLGSPDETAAVRSVENLLIYVDGRAHDPGRPVEVADDALVYPGNHLIVVSPDRDARARR
jgi:predicted phage baseplate assembly protein